MTDHDHLSDHDELMDLLRSARPELPEELTSPTSAPALALRQEILDMEPDTDGTTPTTPTTSTRRSRWVVGSIAGIAAATLAVTFVSARDDGHPASTASPSPTTMPAEATSTPLPDVVDVELIADRSTDALARSGRARVVFATDLDGPQYAGSSGTADLAFSGDDIEMTIAFNGFTAQNKTVDGEFYLLDGPIGQKAWVHDTNESGARSGDLFSLDPRSLLTMLSAETRLEVVGTEDVDGVSTRHLRSTTSFGASELNLGLGPAGDSTITQLDLWVGDDDVTRRVDIALSQQVERGDIEDMPVMSKEADGTVVLTYPSGKVARFAPGEPVIHEFEGTPYDQRSSYSVTFSDIGAPVTVDAPAEYTDVAGQG